MPASKEDSFDHLDYVRIQVRAFEMHPWLEALDVLSFLININSGEKKKKLPDFLFSHNIPFGESDEEINVVAC